MQVMRWGEDLVVRLPGDIVATLGLREGDEVMIEVTPAAGVAKPLGDASSQDDGARRKVAERLSALGLRVPSENEIDPVRRAAIARLRAGATPLPPGYKFDREEANERYREEAHER